MKYNRLGRTHLNISQIGYGGLPLYYRSRDEAVELLNAALDAGINYVDCDEAGSQFVADAVYRDTAAKLGDVLRTRRNEVYVGIKSMFATRDEIARDIDRALELIFKGSGREVIDIFHLAHVDTDEKLDLLLSDRGGIAAAEEARAQGKLDHLLVASHNPRVLLRALQSGRFDVAEFPFTIIEQEYLREVIPWCRAHDIGTIIMKPIGGGQMETCADLSLRWILGHGVDVVIPGMKSMDELRRNLSTVTGAQPLSSAELHKLHELSQAIGKEYCHRCGYCLPCPQGIHIIGQFDVFRSRLFGLERKREIFRQMKEQGAATAEDCVGCGECVEKCPFKLPIPEMMEKIRQGLAE